MGTGSRTSEGRVIVDNDVLRIEELRQPDQVEGRGIKEYLDQDYGNRGLQPLTGDEVVYCLRKASGAVKGSSYHSCNGDTESSQACSSEPQVVVLGSPNVPIGLSSALGYLRLGHKALVHMPQHLMRKVVTDMGGTKQLPRQCAAQSGSCSCGASHVHSLTAQGTTSPGRIAATHGQQQQHEPFADVQQHDTDSCESGQRDQAPVQLCQPASQDKGFNHQQQQQQQEVSAPPQAVEAEQQGLHDLVVSKQRSSSGRTLLPLDNHKYRQQQHDQPEQQQQHELVEHLASAGVQCMAANGARQTVPYVAQVPCDGPTNSSSDSAAGISPRTPKRAPPPAASAAAAATSRLALSGPARGLLGSSTGALSPIPSGDAIITQSGTSLSNNSSWLSHSADSSTGARQLQQNGPHDGAAVVTDHEGSWDHGWNRRTDSAVAEINAAVGGSKDIDTGPASHQVQAEGTGWTSSDNSSTAGDGANAKIGDEHEMAAATGPEGFHTPESSVYQSALSTRAPSLASSFTSSSRKVDHVLQATAEQLQKQFVPADAAESGPAAAFAVPVVWQDPAASTDVAVLGSAATAEQVAAAEAAGTRAVLEQLHRQTHDHEHQQHQLTDQKAAHAAAIVPGYHPDVVERDQASSAVAAAPAGDSAAVSQLETVPADWLSFELEVLAIIPGRGKHAAKPILSNAAQAEGLDVTDITQLAKGVEPHLRPRRQLRGVSGWVRRHLSVNYRSPYGAGKQGLRWLGIRNCLGKQQAVDA